MNSVSSKKVLVTGADGFIGSHLVEMLADRGADVTALALYNSFNHWGCLEGLACLKRIRVATGDIRDLQFCLGLLENVEIVLHLAALVPIPYSYKAPNSYLQTNALGTLNMCQAALNARVSRMVCVSSSEVYGTAKYIPIDESHPIKAQSPYSATKIAAEALATSFYCSFGLPIVIARPFNTYGPRQSARAIIPTIISQIAAGQKKVFLGNLDTERDFTFVRDTSAGLIALAEMEGGVGDVFNIGSGTATSINQLFCTIKELMCSDAEICFDPRRVRPELSEVLRLHCNAQKLAAASGFRALTPLRTGLLETISWHDQPESRGRYKADIYNV